MASRGNQGTAGATTTPATAGHGEAKPKLFDEQGAIGKQFTETGAVGGTAQSIGGPLDKEGIIGKQFTTEGSIGGSVESMLGGKNEKSN